MKYEYKADGYKPDNEIFVFGSNLAGIHGAGAAQEAYRNYGAIWGIGYGMHGQSYALPTKNRRIQTMPLKEIRTYVELFKDFASMNTHLKFYVSRVGCGLAGYEDKDIAPFFRGSPFNCLFAEPWKEYLE